MIIMQKAKSVLKLIFRRLAQLFLGNQPRVIKFAECIDVARVGNSFNWEIPDMSNPQLIAAQKNS